MAIREIVRDGKKTGYDVQVSVRHPETRKKQFLRRRVATKWEANEVERKLKQELVDKLNGNKIPSWEQFVPAYEHNCLVNKAGSTKHNELSILNSHAMPLLRNKLLDQITQSDVREIINRSNRSLSLKHNIRKCLSNVFNYAIECRYIQINPCSRLRLSKIPEPVLNILSEEQIRLFLRKAEETGTEWYPIWALGIYTGMRSGELIALRWKCVQESQGRWIVRVQEAWTKQGGYHSTKGREIRTVPMNLQVQKLFEQLRSQYSGDPESFVLPQISAWRQGDAAKELRAFLRGSELPPIRFHDLRSCFITQCLLHGVSPIVVMKMAGHSSLKTTMRYIRLVGSDIMGQTDVLDFS